MFVKIWQNVVFGGAQFRKVQGFIPNQWMSNEGILGEGNVTVRKILLGREASPGAPHSTDVL